jgi:transcriptional regulator of acetoin/glycerol metabolism
MGGGKMYDKYNHSDIVKRSHERSLRYGIEKERVVSKKILNHEDMVKNISKNKGILQVAAPFMEDLYDFLRGSGYILVLTDRDGCILSIIGDDEIVKAASELDMIEGAYMDERSIGTNAMGTAISEGSPVQISAKEHFIAAYHRWTCTAAPIHNTSGKIIGTLNLTGASNLVHPHTLGLVVAAVRSIEYQLKSDAVQNKLREAYQYNTTIMDSISSGIIAVDREGIIKSINNTACRMLKADKSSLTNNSIKSFIHEWTSILEYLFNGKLFQDEEISINIDGNKEKYNFNFNAHPIKDDENNIIGCVITLKEMQKVINLVNRYTGMRARYTFEDIVGSSQIVNIIGYAKQVASGTGKEVLAQAIHNYSDRRDNGFVAINCGAISKNLIESELFGYDEGAFTGAKKGGHLGKFELANGGTLFLDEIGEMPLAMQVNLLRVLQEGYITRVGGNKCIPVNVRIIAATNRNLKKEVEHGTFRQDLYYRISVIPILLPPLRERKADIKILAEYFLKIKAAKLGGNVEPLSSKIIEWMLGNEWNGNIRELENFIEKYIILKDRVILETEDSYSLNNDMKESVTNAGVLKEDVESMYTCSLNELEKKAINATLKKFSNNITKASEALGISRNTLYLKMKKYSINELTNFEVI